MSINPLLSPGWSHYIIVAPLSPKARVNLNRKLRLFSDRDPHFKPLASHLLSLPLLDLGVLSEAIEPRITSVLEGLVQTCASLQIHTRGWSVDLLTTSPQNRGPTHASARNTSHSSSNKGFLWLNWEDRLGMLSILRREFERELKRLCVDLCYVTPQSAESSPQKKRAHFSVLCGSFSHYKPETYQQVFKGSAWHNDICLQKRPQLFHPSNGYQNVWRRALPFETPVLTDDHDVDSNTIAPRKSAQDASDSTLTGRELELFNLLEQRLEKIPLTSSPSNHAKSPGRRRRRPRNKKRSS